MPAKVLTLRPSPRTLASARLRRARFTAELTQEQVAQLLGIDARQVRRWENGESPMGALEALVLLELEATGRRAA